MNIFRTIANWWTFVRKCSTPGCNNPNEVFGVCESCFEKEIRQSNQEVREEDHEKLVRAVKQALKEIEAEKKL